MVRNANVAPVPCPGEPAELWVVAGQSNAAGSAQPPDNVPAGDVYQFHQGRCYPLVNPVFGASSLPDGFNPFVYVANDYSARHDVSVVVRFVAVGGTSIEQWVSPGGLADALHEELLELSTLGPVHRLLWQQGESDALAGMGEREYLGRLDALLRTVRGSVREVHVARSSRCYEAGPDTPVGLAQGTLGGPNTDTLGPEFRYDGCHLNAQGVVKFSAIWNDFLRR